MSYCVTKFACFFRFNVPLRWKILHLWSSVVVVFLARASPIITTRGKANVKPKRERDPAQVKFAKNRMRIDREKYASGGYFGVCTCTYLNSRTRSWTHRSLSDIVLLSASYYHRRSLRYSASCEPAAKIEAAFSIFPYIMWNIYICRDVCIINRGGWCCHSYMRSLRYQWVRVLRENSRLAKATRAHS